ncbi:pimeloyl-ACP methyl ester carboxylesterase [Granulicella aggregans]|uniref:Pimeloyl-ACP methyl ester carboxylesterase n=1 Tax=Granulicella aggregans TaxID=474949 RepID=A0A7W7ZC34_9BACT|nr:alpha/beta fold hydrolase [Granulicella aggregans]MBB5057175.1 pimeloyl-ACP methyl ester carboxylesterase [Granulicella aggregans]
MRLFTTALLSASFLACSGIPASPQAQTPAAITTDPAPDKAHPAAFDTFQLPSHGAQLNAFVYIAAGAGPHPTVILLHGFPGNEKNLDLAQTLRRAGYDILFFNYRGSWGSPGDFSFTHSIEDVQSAIAYLRDPINATRLRVDSKQIILIGHSMGGFMARYAGAQDPGIKAVGLISAADMAVDKIETIPTAYRNRAVDPIAKSFAEEGLAPLAGCTPKSLAEEAVANSDAWNIPNLAPKLASRPVLDLTSDDGLAPSNDAFVSALKKSGSTHVFTQHFATDHSYSDQRIAMQIAILNWLAAL